MTPSYAYPLEQLRRTLLLEPEFKRTASRFFDIVEDPEFWQHCHTVTDSSILGQISFWLTALDQIPTDGRSRKRKKQRLVSPFGPSTPSLIINDVFKLNESYFFHGRGYHDRRRLVFFMFPQDQMGFAVRLRKQSHELDFFRLKLCRESELHSGIN